MIDVTTLRSRTRGPVLTSADAEFAEAVAGTNTAVTNSPDVAVVAEDAGDVVAAVRFAREQGLKVRVQTTGHGAHAPVVDGVLVLMDLLDTVRVDPWTRIATAGGGARWSTVVAAAAEHGLAPITGSSTGVGVVGFLTGGGLGPLSRSHGFGSDHVRGFSVVTGRGEVVQADLEHNPDLFWALRGGKGGLGIVTEVRLELASLPGLYAGSLMFEEQHIEAVTRGWLDYTATAPDEVTTSLVLVRFPPLDFIPEPLRGRKLAGVRFAYPGDVTRGERLAQPLRDLAPVYLDGVQDMPLDQVHAIHDDPSGRGPGWSSGVLLDHADQDFATALLGAVGPGVDVPLVAVEVRHLGAATRQDVPEGSAVGGRGGAYALTLIGVPDPALFIEVVPRAADRVFAAVSDWVASESNINFERHGMTAEGFDAAWPPATRRRLEAVRERVDPGHVFAYGPES